LIDEAIAIAAELFGALDPKLQPGSTSMLDTGQEEHLASETLGAKRKEDVKQD
jgi:hypothetical protein